MKENRKKTEIAWVFHSGIDRFPCGFVSPSADDKSLIFTPHEEESPTYYLESSQYLAIPRENLHELAQKRRLTESELGEKGALATIEDQKAILKLYHGPETYPKATSLRPETPRPEGTWIAPDAWVCHFPGDKEDPALLGVLYRTEQKRALYLPIKLGGLASIEEATHVISRHEETLDAYKDGTVITPDQLAMTAPSISMTERAWLRRAFWGCPKLPDTHTVPRPLPTDDQGHAYREDPHRVSGYIFTVQKSYWSGDYLVEVSDDLKPYEQGPRTAFLSAAKKIVDRPIDPKTKRPSARIGDMKLEPCEDDDIKTSLYATMAEIASLDSTLRHLKIDYTPPKTKEPHFIHLLRINERTGGPDPNDFGLIYLERNTGREYFVEDLVGSRLCGVYDIREIETRPAFFSYIREKDFRLMRTRPAPQEIEDALFAAYASDYGDEKEPVRDNRAQTRARREAALKAFLQTNGKT